MLWDLTQFSCSPSPALLYFPNFYWWFEISSLSKVIFISGKARSHWAPNLGCGGVNHLGDLMFCHKLCTRCDAWAGVLLWWSSQSPVARSCGFGITWIVSLEECSNLTQNLMQIRCSTHSVILNVMATQYTCSLDGVSHPHGLAQWSHHCWCTFQSTLLGCQFTWLLHEPFSLY